MYRSYDHVPTSHNRSAEVDFNQLHNLSEIKEGDSNDCFWDLENSI